MLPSSLLSYSLQPQFPREERASDVRCLKQLRPLLQQVEPSTIHRWLHPELAAGGAPLPHWWQSDWKSCGSVAAGVTGREPTMLPTMLSVGIKNRERVMGQDWTSGWKVDVVAPCTPDSITA